MEKAVTVVGGGLAGTLVATRLVQAGEPVRHHTPLLPGGASVVAAGLYNTYTGQGLRRTWQADRLVEELHALFAQPWMAPAGHHHHPLPIYRPFPDGGTANVWTSASVGHAAVEILLQPWRPEVVHNPLGGLLIHGLGWVDIPGLLASLAAFLQNEPGYERVETVYAYAALPTTPTVFCEGVGVNRNPWRPFRALEPLKGEILHVELPGLALDRVVSHGVYVLPRPDGTYAVGATYEKDPPHPDPTPAGQAALLEKLARLFPGQAVTVLQHRAGLRPTTPDRKPVMGRHPAHPQLWFLNGLGTKGLLYAPYTSRLLVEALLEDDEGAIPPELHLGRKAVR